MADAFPERGRIISALTGTRLRAWPEWAEKAAAEKHRTVARASRAKPCRRPRGRRTLWIRKKGTRSWRRAACCRSG
jgi:hypothetical protein